MAHVRSTAHVAGGATGSSGEDHGSEGLADRPKSTALSDMGSHSGAGGGADEGSCVRSYFFGPSTMTVNHGYFAEGMGHEPGEEVVPEPQPNEAVFLWSFFRWSKDAPTLYLLTFC
jgi:hypothetical protein